MNAGDPRHLPPADDPGSRRFSRLPPGQTPPPLDAEAPRATRTQRVIEIFLFGITLLMLGVGVIALYTAYAPSYRTIENRFAEGVQSDRLNLLLFGIGGDTHPGGGKDLADAILLVSMRPSTGDVALLSIPRDLYIPLGRYGEHRINRAHQIGQNTGYPGGGAALLMDAAEHVLGVPIHAYARIDFEGFRKLIDDLGGIEVHVPQGFYDYLWRDRVVAGHQRMDGERALRYARYRYIIGEEGSNYARERRQQQVLSAVLNKLRSRDGNDIATMIRAARTLSRHTETNLTNRQLLWIYRNFGDTPLERMRKVTMRPYTESFQVRSFADAGDAVRPRGGSFDQIRDLARDIFNVPVEASSHLAKEAGSGAPPVPRSAGSQS